MQSKLSLICDRVIEAGWLAAAVFTPLYFNVYSSRVFEPDKISLLRNIVLMMTLAWFIKLIEGALAAKGGTGTALEAAAPGWLPRLFRVPLMIPLILYAAVYLFSTVTSVVPLTAFFGSYQRFQGLISQYTYIMLALMILANLRSRAQLNRLITFAIATSVPVAAYGLLQRAGLDPLPWAGDVESRVASSLGNAIFVGAYLIMIVPLTLQRLVAVLAAWRGSDEAAPARERREDPWPLLVIGGGAVFLLLLIQYAGMVSGNFVDGFVQQDYQPIGEFFAWAVVLLAAGGFVWLAARMAPTLGLAPIRTADGSDPNTPPPVLLALLPLVQVAVIWIGIKVIGATQVPDFRLWIIYPAAIFIFYILTFLYTLTARPSRAALSLQLVGLPILLLMQIVVVFLTQSRGPELGLLTGLGVFAFAYLWRRRLYRAFAVATVVAVLFVGFLVVFNLPNSPIAAWRTLPYVGRLGLISQLDEGTGKVRTLIWGGATNLIKSDPVRMIIGWGPEAMYVAYNRFYPPELAHWELRNATPDRSHDVFFDQAVTMGLLGLAAYLILIGSFVWIAVRAIRRAGRLPDQLLLIGFLAMVLAHVVEAAVGIEIAATYTYVYIAFAGVVVLGYVLNPAAAPVLAPAAVGADDLSEAALADSVVAANGNGHAEAVPAATNRAVADGATRTATLPTTKGQAAGNGNGNGSARRPVPATGRSIPPPRGNGGPVRPD
ncbi:MAG: O-antigen ligase family protein, partial [Chloroflexota bacterium]|nr:O-antigen ligase family protein [Chloroflexota bacterium]